MVERLYYRDSYLREFQATVESVRQVEQGLAVELDRTLFYPTSGGQPHDQGWLNQLPVREVFEEDGAIVHLMERGELRAGESAAGKINWERRFDHMQQHTGQHILSQAFLRTLNAETVSFHLGAEISTVDLAVEQLAPEEIYRAEDLSNQIIFENRPVKILFVSDEEQSQLPLRKHSGREGIVRIIEVSDFDWSPCGGTHCRQTGEIGLIKVRRWERVKQRARVEFYCGWRALQDYRSKNRAVYRLSQLFSSAEREVVEFAERQLARERELQKSAAEWEEQALKLEAEKLASAAKEEKGISVVAEILNGRNLQQAQRLARTLIASRPRQVVLFGIAGQAPGLVFACSDDLPYDMREWIRIAAPLIEGRGGGKAKEAQAGGRRLEGLGPALERALALI